MNMQLRVLHIEDSAEDSLRIVEELLRGGWELTYKRVETAETMSAALQAEEWDFVISDYALPHFNGFEALDLLKKTGLDLPFIMVSGVISEEKAVTALKNGAHDFITKQNLARLLPAVSRELRDAKIRREKTKADEAKRESEERFRDLFENSNDMIQCVKPDGSFVYVNPAWLNTLIYTEEDLPNLSMFDVIHPDSKNHCMEMFQRVMAGEKPDYVEAMFITKDGRVINVEGSSSCLYKEGEPVATRGIFRDITARKKAENELAKRLEIERVISHISSNFIDTQNLDSVIEDALGAVGSLTGADRAYLYLFKDGDEYFRNTHEWCAEGITSQIENRKRMQSEDFSWWIDQLRNGETICINDMSTIPDEEKNRAEFIDIKSVLILPVILKEGLAGFMGINRMDQKKEWDSEDLFVMEVITRIIGTALERRRTEMQHLRLSTAVEQSAEAMVVTDEKGTIQYVNPSFERITGYSSEEAVGKNMSILKSGEHDDKFYKNLWKTISSGEVWSGRLKNRRKDGTIYEEEATISPIRNNRGKIINYVSVKRDVTKLGILEAELRQAQKLESIGQLAAGIAHEINTPIQYIGDNTRFIQKSVVHLEELIGNYREIISAAEQGSVPPELIASVKDAASKMDVDFLFEEIPGAVEQTLAGVERVAKIVLAMKEFSHPGSVEMELANINDALDSTITIARNEWKYVADLETDFDPDIPLVPCLVAEFNQVILNLIVNAAHTITDKIGKDPLEKGKIAIRTRQVDNHIEIAVSDTGMGIPEKARERVFDPFYTTKEVGRGSGQGLAIARSVVVDKHKGKITFESEIGEGTTFFILLPLHEEK